MTKKLEDRLKQYWIDSGESTAELSNFLGKSEEEGGISLTDWLTIESDISGTIQCSSDKANYLVKKWEDERKYGSPNDKGSVQHYDNLSEQFKTMSEKVRPLILDAVKHKGLRFNTGKLRYDLVHPWAHEQMVRVLTKGAEKYAERNWEKGMAWSNVIASLKRHMAGIEKGEDYDPETGELHAAHLACNAHFLTAYYKIYPQGDDRPHTYLSRPKIGLDVDEVIADWVGKWVERHEMVTPEFWNFDKDIKQKFEEVKDDKEFWMSIKPKISPKDLPFEPHCYITSRPVPTEWTVEWLQQNGFPIVPVYTVGHNESKVQVAKDCGIDIFVDDRYDNFVELNQAGICTFLMDAPHNQRYDVGFKIIHDLKELL